MYVFRGISILILLYQERKLTLFVGRRDGSVRADDRLAFRIFQSLWVGRPYDEARRDWEQRSLAVRQLKNEPAVNNKVSIQPKVYT